MKQKCSRCEFYPRAMGDLCGRCAVWAEREKRGDTRVRCDHPDHRTIAQLAACIVDQAPPSTPSLRADIAALLWSGDRA